MLKTGYKLAIQSRSTAEFKRTQEYVLQTDLIPGTMTQPCLLSKLNHWAIPGSSTWGVGRTTGVKFPQAASVCSIRLIIISTVICPVAK